MKKSKTVFYSSEALTADDTSASAQLMEEVTNVMGFLKVSGGGSTTTTDVKFQHSPDGTNWEDLKAFTQVVGVTGQEFIQLNNTTEHVMPYIRVVVDLGVVLQATVTVELHYAIL